MLKWLNEQRKIFEVLCVIFLIVALVGLSCSASVITIGLILSAVMSLLAGSFSRLRIVVSSNPFLFALFFLWLVMLFGVFHNHFVPNHGWHQFKKYVGDWVIGLLIMPVFTKKKYRRIIFTAVVVIAAITSVIIFYCHHAHIVRIHQKVLMAEIINPIPWSYFLAFSCFVLGHQLLDIRGPKPVGLAMRSTPSQVASAKEKWLFGKWLAGSIVFVWLFYSLYFINRERSGMLAGLVLAVVFTFQRLTIKKAWVAIFGLVACSIGLFYWSPTVHLRVLAVVQNVQQFFDGHSATSIGLRMAFAKNSWHLIAQKPWLGYGTGSFSMAYHTTGGPSLLGTTYLGDPHNSYLHLWVQLGLLGLIPFVVFLVWQFLHSFQLPRFEKFLMQGLTLSYVVFCACISAFLRQRAVLFYLILLLVGFAASRLKTKER